METGQETDIIELNVHTTLQSNQSILAYSHESKYSLHKEAYSVQQTMTVAHPLKNVVQL